MTEKEATLALARLILGPARVDAMLKMTEAEAEARLAELEAEGIQRGYLDPRKASTN